jgi:hypothetical protein
MACLIWLSLVFDETEEPAELFNADLIVRVAPWSGQDEGYCTVFFSYEVFDELSRLTVAQSADAITRQIAEVKKSQQNVIMGS